MNISVAPLIESKEVPIVSLLSKKAGLYTGPFPNFKQFLVSEARSDIILCPHNLKAIENNKSYIESLEKLSKKKPVLVLNFGDFPRKKLLGNFIHLQTSHEIGAKFNPENTIIVPLNAKKIQTPIRNFSVSPEISFVGQVPKQSVGRVFRSLFPIPPAPWQTQLPHPVKRNSALIRAFGVKALYDINATTIKRLHHSGTKARVKDLKLNRKLYELVLTNSDIVFCPRGDANTSVRLYECIGAGRIPVVPKTKTYLPDLKNDSISDLLISCSSMSYDLEKQVNEWWSGLTPESYFSRQIELRRIFDQRLSFKGFFENLFRGKFEDLFEHRPTII